jgi:hypothetical protein
MNKILALIGFLIVTTLAIGADSVNDFIIPSRGAGGLIILEPRTAAGVKTRILTADPANGGIGIGTAPSYPLHIVKNAAGQQAVVFSNNSTGSSAATAFVASNGTNELRLLRPGTNYNAYGSLTSTDGALYSDYSLNLMADNASGVIKFSAGGNSEKMRIDNAGRVGIGTTNPVSKVHINMPASPVSSPTTSTALRNYALMLPTTGDSTVGVYSAIIGGPNIDGSTAMMPAGVIFGRTANSHGTYVGFHTHGANTNSDEFIERMRIADDGKVGIGTTSPSIPFEVKGTASGYYTNNTTTVGTVGNIYSTSMTNGQVFTMDLGSSKLFTINTGGGQAALVFADYSTSTITILANPSSAFEASSTPATNKIGIYKSSTNHTISIKSAFTSTVVVGILVIGPVTGVTSPI